MELSLSSLERCENIRPYFSKRQCTDDRRKLLRDEKLRFCLACLHYVTWQKNIPFIVLLSPEKEIVGIFMMNPDYFPFQPIDVETELNKDPKKLWTWRHRERTLQDRTWQQNVFFGKVKNFEDIFDDDGLKFASLIHNELCYSEFVLDYKHYRAQVDDMPHPDYPRITITLKTREFSIQKLQRTYMSFLMEGVAPNLMEMYENDDIVRISKKGIW